MEDRWSLVNLVVSNGVIVMHGVFDLVEVILNMYGYILLQWEWFRAQVTREAYRSCVQTMQGAKHQLQQGLDPSGRSLGVSISS